MIIIKEDTPKKLSGNSSLFLSFPYNEDIINIIKQLEVAIYHKKDKVWEVPIYELSFLLDSLTYFDDIKLELIKNNNIRENLLKPKLSYKIKPFKHQEEAIAYGLNNDK